MRRFQKTTPRKNYPALLLSALVLVLGGCGKSPFCWSDDKNLGLIESCPHLPCVVSLRPQILIDSDSAYRALLPAGSPCTLEPIDFTAHTLLGQCVTGGCTLKLRREVKAEGNTYVYHIAGRDCGICKRKMVTYNWVLVPKLPPGWTVRFSQEVR